MRRAQLVRTRLEDAGPDVRMVESLAPMWEEERLRCGGSGPPAPPPDPPRDPQPLCPAVDATRAQFQARSPRTALSHAPAAFHAPSPHSSKSSSAALKDMPSWAPQSQRRGAAHSILAHVLKRPSPFGCVAAEGVLGPARRD